MLRLFAGIEVPQAHRMRLGFVRAPLPSAKWVDPEDMHLTLRFAGDIDNRQATDFAEFLAAIEIRPFEVRIADLGVFGGREPRVLWAGVMAASHSSLCIGRQNARHAQPGSSRSGKVQAARDAGAAARDIARRVAAFSDRAAGWTCRRSQSSASCCSRRGRMSAADLMWSRTPIRSRGDDAGSSRFSGTM